MSYRFFKKKATIGFGVISQEPGEDIVIDDSMVVLSVKRKSPESNSSTDNYIGINISADGSGNPINVYYNNKKINFTSGTLRLGLVSGVDDGTAESGTLIISGGYASWGQYNYSKTVDKSTKTFYCSCVTDIIQFGVPTSIPTYALYSAQITSAIIPNTVTTISNYAFYYCSYLENVIISDGVTSIGQYAFNNAFYNSVSESSIIIPNSITSIGADAFGAPDNVYYNGYMGE